MSIDIDTDVSTAVGNLKGAIAQGRERLAKFAERVTGDDPAKAFQWGQDDLKWAALVTVSSYLLRIVEQNGVEKARAVALERALWEARHPTCSTSVLWNSTATTEASIYARFAQDGYL